MMKSDSKKIRDRESNQELKKNSAKVKSLKEKILNTSVTNQSAFISKKISNY